MSKVNNKKVIHHIADNTRKASKGRNIVSILAIMLTTLLFTSVFTVGGSIISKQQESTMRQVGGSSHAEYKYLTMDEYETVKSDSELKEVSYRIIVGNVINEKLTKLHTEASYYEDLNAKFSYCYPEYGTMPQKENEIVTSDLVLEALGVPCELGQEVTLIFDIGGKIVEENFVLSGYYRGDTMSNAQIVAVSKAYQEKVTPLKENSVMSDTWMTEEDYTGRIMADFNFKSSLNLEQQLNALLERCGFPETVSSGINWAYLGGEMDLEVILLAAVLLGVILLSGYLIIYNIFYINVFAEIRHYGLLKTIGTTGHQLKKIVRRQAYMLSLVGIPIGLLFGAGVGKIILPVIMGQLNFSGTINTQVELNGWIFAGSAVFSFFTVYISCIKPCRMAAKVTPVEAVKYSEASDNIKKEKFAAETEKEKTAFETGKGIKSGTKAKKNKLIKTGIEKRRETEIVKKRVGKITPETLAFQNVKRSRKKMIIVVVSLSLSLILLNSVYSLIRGFDMEKFASTMAVTDFSVCDATLDNVSVDTGARVIDGVTEEFEAELNRQKGIEEIGNVYLEGNEYSPVFTEEDWAKIEERILDNPVVSEEFGQLFGDAPGTTVEQYLENIRINRDIDGEVYGIGELIMEKLENVEGELDWEKFRTGDYVITTRYESLGESDTVVNYFYPGEKVTVYNADGEAKEYEVMAVADMPYVCGFQVYRSFNCNYILPEEEFLEFMGARRPMRTLFNVNPEYEEEIETWISNYCENINPNLDYTSKATILEEFDSMKQMYGIVGGLLALILALIGILNFINTMVTSVLSRKQELAMMEAVGMTGKQQTRMLVWEGIYYAAFTFVAAILLGGILNAAVVRQIGSAYYFFTWHFTVTPILVCIPAVLAVVILVPAICYRKIQKVSVVERMRTSSE